MMDIIILGVPGAANYMIPPLPRHVYNQVFRPTGTRLPSSSWTGTCTSFSLYMAKT